MTDSTPVAEHALPPAVQESLSRLINELSQSLGQTLISVVLFGDLAKEEEFEVGHGEVKVLIALERVTRTELDAISASVRRAIERINLAPMIVSLDDLKRSTDVFPIKFLDMQEHHRVLAGRDVLTRLEIHQDHLRLRCEQELKNLHLRLNVMYVRNGGRAKALRSLLERLVEPLLLDLRVLLLLKQQTAPVRRDEIISQVSDSFDMDGALLRRILDLRHSKDRKPLAELAEMIDGLMHLVQRASLIADRL